MTARIRTVYMQQFEKDELRPRLASIPGLDFVAAKTAAELRKIMPGAELLIANNRFYDEEVGRIVLEHGKDLRWIQYWTAGIERGIRYGMPRGIPVCAASGVKGPTVAEHALLLLLAHFRRFREIEQARSRRDWIRDHLHETSRTLEGATLVIVGFGAIGQQVARKAKAFDMTVTGISRTTDAIAHVDRIRPRGELQAAAAEADIVVVAAISNEETEKIVSRGVIGAMKPTAYVVNIARGAMIDEPALIEALQAGKIAGAGLDVAATEPLPAGHPFWTLENVLISPHIAGAGGQGDTHAGFIKIFTDNLRRWVDGKPLTKVVVEKTA